jgi:hypothetical protein
MTVDTLEPSESIPPFPQQKASTIAFCLESMMLSLKTGSKQHILLLSHHADANLNSLLPSFKDQLIQVILDDCQETWTTWIDL